MYHHKIGMHAIWMLLGLKNLIHSLPMAFFQAWRRQGVRWRLYAATSTPFHAEVIINHHLFICYFLLVNALTYSTYIFSHTIGIRTWDLLHKSHMPLPLEARLKGYFVVIKINFTWHPFNLFSSFYLPHFVVRTFHHFGF